MKFSVIVPAHNEDGGIASSLALLTGVLAREQLDYEVVVADHCNEQPEARVKELAARNPRLRWVPNPQPCGFGMAVRCGLAAVTAAGPLVFTAAASDDPADRGRHGQRLEPDAECVFARGYRHQYRRRWATRRPGANR